MAVATATTDGVWRVAAMVGPTKICAEFNVPPLFPPKICVEFYVPLFHFPLPKINIIIVIDHEDEDAEADVVAADDIGGICGTVTPLPDAL